MRVYFNIVIGHLGRPHSTHTAPNASPDGLCARTHTNEPFLCWFCCKSLRVDRARRGNVCFQRHGSAAFRISKARNVLFLILEKNLPSAASKLYADRMCTMWAVSLRHAASVTTAVRPALLMGGRGGSAVDVVVVAPVLGNRCVKGRRGCSFFVFKNLTFISSYYKSIRAAAGNISICLLYTSPSPRD